MDTPSFLVFLDFDGVTHPVPGFAPSTLDEVWQSGIYSNGTFFRRENVVQVNRLVHKLDAAVVISSSWRLEFGWEPFRPLFISRVIGQTPLLYGTERWNEINAYRDLQRLLDVPFLVLDDNGWLFPPDAPVHICDGKVGLTAEETDRLIERYDGRG